MVYYQGIETDGPACRPHPAKHSPAHAPQRASACKYPPVLTGTAYNTGATAKKHGTEYNTGTTAKKHGTEYNTGITAKKHNIYYIHFFGFVY